jgi:SAM-dependent methyltransferase
MFALIRFQPKADEYEMIDVHRHNQDAWNTESRSGSSPWCQPVNESTIEKARNGDWEVVLTLNRSVPRTWFDGVEGKRVLCLASGGGQQVPILAAAGARVTSFDISEEQLAKDGLVATREGLDINLIQGDMTDLSCFGAERFDLVFHPVSNVFSSDVRVVWRECYRVLASDGRLLSGFMNPAYYLFDHDSLEEGGPLLVRNRLPFAENNDLSPERLEQRLNQPEALVYSHSLDDQIGGQIDAGFLIAGFYEDEWTDEASRLNSYMPIFIATLALKI